MNSKCILAIYNTGCCMGIIKVITNINGSVFRVKAAFCGFKCSEIKKFSLLIYHCNKSKEFYLL